MGEFIITQSTPNNEKLYLYPSRDLSGCIDFDPSTGSSNSDLVDDPKYNVDTDDYVETDSTTFINDLYKFTNHGSEVGTINYVKEYVTAKADYVQDNNVNFYLISSPDSICTDYYTSDEKPLTNAWRKHSYVWSENPKTSTSWDWTDIDSMSLGIRAKSSIPANAQVNSVTLRPNDPGSLEQLDVEPNRPNWMRVDDSTVNKDDYVYTFSGRIQPRSDLYNIETYSFPGTIKSVTVYAYVYGGDNSQYGDLWLLVRTGGTTYESSKKNFSFKSWVYQSHTWNTNPDTGSAWTQSDINSLQIGLKMNITIPYRYRAAQVYAVVEYYNLTAPTIYMSQCYAEVGYTPDSRSCTLSKPTQWTSDHDRATKMINFWDGSREVYDLYRTGKRAVLKGVEYSSDNSFTPCTRISCIRTLARNGATITLSDTGMDCLDHDFKIMSFGWKLVSKKPQVYEWMLELEYTEL